MTYSVKEVFYTLQGEGANAGTAAVFCRFAGCNLWSGRERDRNRAVCKFCDTDFVGTNGTGGGKYSSAAGLAEAISSAWGDRAGSRKFVVITGGEPALQLDTALVDALHDRAFRIAIETNGTIPLTTGIDWVCVSPKAGTNLVVRKGNELKLVIPQEDWPPDLFVDWEFDHLFLSPMDGPDRRQNMKSAVAYCLAHPRWRLSLQTHKVLGIP